MPIITRTRSGKIVRTGTGSRPSDAIQAQTSTPAIPLPVFSLPAYYTWLQSELARNIALTTRIQDDYPVLCPCEQAAVQDVYRILQQATLAGYKAYSARRASEHLYKIDNPRYPGQYLTLDPDQRAAIAEFRQGKSIVITGPAGSGKTLLLQALCLAWLHDHQSYDPYDRRTVYPSYLYKLPVAQRAPGQTGELAKIWAPAIAVCSFTNKAVGVLRQKILANPRLTQAGFGANLLTMHALCEFEPVYVESKQDPTKEVRRFFPTRASGNPFVGLQCLIIDEASMPGVGDPEASNPLEACQIWDYVYNAIEAGTQVVLVGDINQVQPVGGKSILTYGLNQLPVHALTHFHRQAAESPIIAGAHDILAGVFPTEATNPETKDTLALRFWPKQDAEVKYKDAAAVHDYVRRGLATWIKRGEYDPETDMFLLPVYKEDNRHTERKLRNAWKAYDAALVELEDLRYGANPAEYKRAKAALKKPKPMDDYKYKSYVSVIKVNKIIATHLSNIYQRMVYSIYAGFDKHFLSIGDRVLVNKIEGRVIYIQWNDKYSGTKIPPAPQKAIDYFGHYAPQGQAREDRIAASKAKKAGHGVQLQQAHQDTDEDHFGVSDEELADLVLTLDDNNDSAVKSTEQEDYASRAASHIATIELDSGEVVTLSTVGDYSENNFQLGYALTVHKAQGSEWNNVFILFHNTHAVTLCREILYTAVTRARSRCILLGDKKLYARAIANPRLQGDSMKEKIAFFNNGYIGTLDISKLA
jgi:hypothetical protein